MHWNITSGNCFLLKIGLFILFNLPFVENLNCVLVKRKRSLN